VREHLALSERFEPHASEEPTPRIRLPFDRVLLLVHVQPASGILVDHARGDPLAKRVRGAGVPVVRLVIARLVAREFEPDRVVWAGVVELLLERGVDHIVRRRDHIGERAHAPEVVPKPAKPPNISHLKLQRTEVRGQRSEYNQTGWPVGFLPSVL